MLRAPRKLCRFSYVLFVFLLFYVLDVVSITVYDRDTLLNIGSSEMHISWRSRQTETPCLSTSSPNHFAG